MSARHATATTREPPRESHHAKAMQIVRYPCGADVAYETATQVKQSPITANGAIRRLNADEYQYGNALRVRYEDLHKDFAGS